MGDVLKKIPYDEDGNLLSFVTDADTVYVGTLTLKEYLASLKSSLQGADGKDGATIDPFEIKYTSVSEDDNNLTYIQTLASWGDTIPNLTKLKPHLWKRTKTVIRNSEGVASLSYDYLYCGSQGTPGIDGEWREWIFKIDDGTTEKEIELTNLLNNCTSENAFKNNDYIPTGWTDDMQEVTDTTKVLWCASRDKIGGVWLEFRNLHIFGRKAKDGETTNSIYTITNEINSTKWSNDKAKLITSIKLSNGEVIGFPTGTEYTWYDDIPHGKEDLIIYLATCYFTGTTCINIDKPIRITGPEGPGSDGNGLEFAYYLSNSKDITIPTIQGSPEHFSAKGGWYDNASQCPITDLNPYQYVCQRLGQYTDSSNWYWTYNGLKYGKSKTDSTVIDYSKAPSGWNYGWSKAMLWSSWGQDGVDGDGVQYVFLRLTQEEYDWVYKYGWDLSNDSYDPPSREPSNNFVDVEGTSYPDPRPEGTPTETSEPEQLGLVDLGLPSGNLWSNVNGVLDEAIKNSDIGGFFAIGELHAYPDAMSTSKRFVIEDYLNDFVEEHSSEGWEQMTSYADYGGGMDPFREYVSGGSHFGELWPREYDIATLLLGDGYRIPTKEDWLELFSLDKEWIIMNNQPGYKFTGTNGNTIFLPAYGCARDGYMNSSGGAGLYWSSSPAEDYHPSYFGHMCFYNGGYMFTNNERYHGRPFRVVFNENYKDEPNTFELPEHAGGSSTTPVSKRYIFTAVPQYVSIPFRLLLVSGTLKLSEIDENYNSTVVATDTYSLLVEGLNLTASPKYYNEEVSLTYEGTEHTTTVQITQNPAENFNYFIVYTRNDEGVLEEHSSFTALQLGEGDDITLNLGSGKNIALIIAPIDTGLEYAIYKGNAIDTENWTSTSGEDDVFVQLVPTNFDASSKYSIRLEGGTAE